MSQLNIHMNSTFERDLKKFMKIRHIKTKAEAVRIRTKSKLLGLSISDYLRSVAIPKE